MRRVPCSPCAITPQRSPREPLLSWSRMATEGRHWTTDAQSSRELRRTVSVMTSDHSPDGETQPRPRLAVFPARDGSGQRTVRLDDLMAEMEYEIRSLAPAR